MLAECLAGRGWSLESRDLSHLAAADSGGCPACREVMFCKKDPTAFSFPECVCNYLGTMQEHCNGSNCQCDKGTGQCPCLPNVVGQNCDHCAPNTWQLASGTGCEPCGCNDLHSFGPSCNEVRPRLCQEKWVEESWVMVIPLTEKSHSPLPSVLGSTTLSNTAWAAYQPSSCTTQSPMCCRPWQVDLVSQLWGAD